jgi:DNA-binding response OmpR family regulator
VKSSSKLALIIDDDTYIFSLLTLLIKGKQYSTLHADTLARAKAILTKNSPDLIFIDQRLPDGPGLDFIPDLRKICPGAKIIAITAQDVEENKLKVIEDGADFFLEKPFTVQKIKEILK